MSGDVLAIAAGLFDPSLGGLISTVVIVGGLVLLYVLAARRRGRVSPSPREYRREIDSASRQQETLRRDIEQLMVELRNLAQQLGAQLESQQQKLERTIVDADQRIAELQSLVEPSSAVPAAAPHPSNAARGGAGSFDSSGTASEIVSPPSAYQAVYELSDRGLSPVDVARRIGRTTGEIELILNLRDRP